MKVVPCVKYESTFKREEVRDVKLVWVDDGGEEVVS